ncbi:hypothetical protein F511_45368 [Dorcoceras hygrometricum]|uniref:Uncharacterized protein n=1 Tax=Dorcoceras hygrometricum TaxID=472368 RepID=A0A2Z6ZWN1_9LAMI|nr:hypothetical protein F511_45368 [Dorcoceras hygrometricum]
MRRTPMTFPAKRRVGIQENRTVFSSFEIMHRAALSPVYITASSSATNGNLSGLLQASAVLLFAYWIANFVVPGFIMEDYRKNKSENDQDDPSQDSGEGKQ